MDTLALALLIFCPFYFFYLFCAWRLIEFIGGLAFYRGYRTGHQAGLAEQIREDN